MPVVGVIPYYRDIHLPDEDSVSLEGKNTGTAAAGMLDIAVIRLGHISNFDDFDPFEREPGVHLRYVSDAASLGQPDLIILPGTKTTVDDLLAIRSNGLAAAIIHRAKQGTAVAGICGGYQMLGERILDPYHVETLEPEVQGLDLLPLTTAFAATKQTCRARCRIRAGRGLLAGAEGLEVTGYEIHMGETEGAEMSCARCRGTIGPAGAGIGWRGHAGRTRLRRIPARHLRQRCFPAVAAHQPSPGQGCAHSPRRDPVRSPKRSTTTGWRPWCDRAWTCHMLYRLLDQQ